MANLHDKHAHVLTTVLRVGRRVPSLPPLKFRVSVYSNRRAHAFPGQDFHRPDMPAVENQLFNIKFTAKQIHRMSKKSEKQHQQELVKVKKAIEKGDPESARIYAENAIRIKNTGNNYLRMASRLEAVASRLESAIKMQQVSKQMGSVVKGMDVRSVPAQHAARPQRTFSAPRLHRALPWLTCPPAPLVAAEDLGVHGHEPDRCRDGEVRGELRRSRGALAVRGERDELLDGVDHAGGGRRVAPAAGER